MRHHFQESSRSKEYKRWAWGQKDPAIVVFLFFFLLGGGGQIQKKNTKRALQLFRLGLGQGDTKVVGVWIPRKRWEVCAGLDVRCLLVCLVGWFAGVWFGWLNSLFMNFLLLLVCCPHSD